MTRDVRHGLQLMAANANAGGPADMGLDEGSARGDRQWRQVQAAAEWALRLTPSSVVLVLTPAEARELQSVVGQGWGDGDHAGWLGNRRAADVCRRAMAKLDAARNTDGADTADTRTAKPCQVCGRPTFAVGRVCDRHGKGAR